jgi:hypothetical protein
MPSGHGDETLVDLARCLPDLSGFEQRAHGPADVTTPAE